ncbi:MAG: tetratricopeptide repeat protein [Candidatus Hodarchaeales archaeon]|jgi:tetratricopeptide (TPR) repeat protein
MTTETLETINDVFFQSKFEEALELIDKFEKEQSNSINQESSQYTDDYLQVQLIKSSIFILKEDYLKGLEVAEIIFKLIESLDKPFITIKALVCKINALYELERIDECIEIIKIAESILQNNQGNLKERVNVQARLLAVKGKLCLKQTDFSLALKHLLDSLSLWYQINNIYEIAGVYTQIGLVYATKGDYDKALTYYQKGEEIYKEKLKNEYFLINIANNLGLIYTYNGEYDQASTYYQQGLELSKKLGNIKQNSIISLNMGFLLKSKGEFNSAFDYFLKSQAIFEEQGNKYGKATCFLNIGTIYKTQGNLTLALDNFLKSLSLNEELGDIKQIATNLNNIGVLYLNQGDIEIAISYFNQALKKLESSKYNFTLSDILLNLIETTLIIGEITQSQEYLEKLTAISNEVENRRIEIRCSLGQVLMLKHNKRMKQKVQAQIILEEIISEEIIDYDLTNMAIIYLCEILLFELRSTGNQDAFNETKSLVDRLYANSWEVNSFSLIVESLVLRAKFLSIEGDVYKAQGLLEQALTTAEQKELWSLVLRVKKELKDLEKELPDWFKMIDQLNNIVTRIIQKQQPQIKELAEYAFDHITANLLKVGDRGPEVVKFEPIKFTTDPKSLLHKMAMFYSVSLGQGNEPGIGLFGPLPVPENHTYVAIVNCSYLPDVTVIDPRNPGKSYAMLVFILPNSFDKIFTDREMISNLIRKKLNAIKDIKDISSDWLSSLKKQIIEINKN